LPSSSATYSTDYTINNGDWSGGFQTYTIQPGDTQVLIKVSTIEDGLYGEGDELIAASIASTDATVGTNTATMTIEEHTDAPEVGIFRVGEEDIPEGSDAFFRVFIINGVTVVDDLVANLDVSGETTPDDFDSWTTPVSVTISAGSLENIFAYTTVVDSVDETTERLTFTISSVNYGTVSSVSSSAYHDIFDATATPTLSPTANPSVSPTENVEVSISADSPVTEGSSGYFYLTLSTSWHMAVTVTLSNLAISSATYGSDYTINNGDWSGGSQMYTFQPGTTQILIQVSTISDGLWENGDENIFASIVSTGASVVTSTATMQIVEGTDAPEISIIRVGEEYILNTESADFLIYIENNVVSAVDLDVSINGDGSEVDDLKWPGFTGTVTISAGSSSVFFSVNADYMALYENIAMIMANLLSVTGGGSLTSQITAYHKVWYQTATPTKNPTATPTPERCGLNGEGAVALCKLYETTQGSSSWDIKTNWLTGRPCTNNWYGVTCEERDYALNENGLKYIVTKLSVMSNDLDGYLPTEMGLLTGLESGFEFVSNTLTSTLPTELGHFSLLNQKFKLGTNYLTGTIPHELSGMTALSFNFGLQVNSLHGTIPSTLGLLTKMSRTFTLQENSLEGNIPTELGELSLMTRMFNMADNTLTGGIPTQIGRFTELYQDIVLRNNELTSIPTEFGHFTALTGVFQMNKNKIAGNIPTELGMMTKMVNAFFLHENSFTGEMPSELGTFTEGEFYDIVSAFNLRDNQICGDIPNEVAALSQQMLNQNSNPDEDGWFELVEGNSVGTPCN
jgi:hypothetical protein